MTLKNHWLDIVEKKKLHKEIDEVGLEVWSEDGTLGDLISSLTDLQVEFLMAMKIRDFFADADDYAFGIELIAEDNP